MNKADALKTVLELVTRFEEQLPALKNAKYKEHNLRMEFLNPFWEALGWDVHNKEGKPQAYKEVEQEDTLRIENLRGAPDYCFRKSKDKRFFYLEAKKPIENIKDNIDHAQQTRAYGWNGSLSISILSDFEEFSLYDCTKKPKETDTVRTARLEYFTFRDYEAKWDFIYDTFSREAVMNGSIDQFASKYIKRGKDTVDKEFLISLDNWRTVLAENISLRNKHEIDEDQLNFAVQHIIDRLIFLRIAEDRNIEPYGNLKNQLSGENYYQNIQHVFSSANDLYNAGLFDPAKDQITAKISIDNKVIKEIVSDMYYPKSPYLFDVISVEILGSAYEQFLGKTITINNRGKAIIELKPEVRKAGGVYYTPQYIVDYIVENTVGKLTMNKNPKEVEELKICDPACGSGSFLLGAYQFLLNWHKDYYNQHANKKNPLTPDGNLTTAEKKRILLNNIYGVDIDVNAVEVTKLSLLLKCMEGETQASIAHQMTMFNERVLPTLDDNIKSGNSLIDTDFYDGMIEFEERKIKPFNWQKAFPTVFKNGGFDVVIGNPPYIQSREGQLGDLAKEYYYKHFKTAEYQINTFGLFIEKGFAILKEGALIAYIIPNYWLSTKYDKKLRKLIFQEYNAIELINVYKVFESAVVDTLILIASKTQGIRRISTAIKSIDNKYKSIEERLNAIKENEWQYNEIKNIDISADDINVTFKDSMDLKVDKFLGDYFNLKFGVKLYEVGKGNPPQTKSDSINHIYESDNQIDHSYLKLLKARNIKRYIVDWKSSFVKYGDNLAAPRNPLQFKGDRILIQRIVSKNCLDATYTDEHFICNTDVITLNPKGSINCKFYLGILCSNLIGKYIKSNNINLDRNVFPKINTNTLQFLPVPEIKQSDTVIEKEITRCVDQLLTLNKDLQAETLESKKEQIKRKIDHYEDKINELVYKLYDLTEEEIAIIEKQ